MASSFKLKLDFAFPIFNDGLFFIFLYTADLPIEEVADAHDN